MNEPNHRRPPAPVLHIASVRWWSALAYYALSLAEGMESIGVPSRVVAPHGSPLDRRATALGLAASGWKGLGSPLDPRFLSCVRSLRRAAARGEIGGIFAHTGNGHTAAALALRRLRDPVPLLRVRAGIRDPAGGILQEILYTRTTDRILLSGDFMRARLQRTLRIDPRRVVTLPAGIDPGPARGIDRHRARGRLRADLGWPPETEVVGMLARYSPVKGHRDLVDAARLLAARFPHLRFYAAGPTGQTGRERVAAWVRQAGLEGRFALLDAVEDPLIAAAGFDVAVIASRGSEAVCRNALEYMALGLPIVATRVHVIPETIGEAGILVGPADPEALAGAISSLLVDASLRRSLGSAALRRLEREFDREKVARRAAGLLEEVRREKSSG